MRILFTADLHLLRATRGPILEKLSLWIRRYEPDAIVIAGDISSATQAEEVFASLRTCFPKGQIIVCLGNHDFWLHDSVRNDFRSLEEVIESFWEPAAELHDITLLDVESDQLDDVAIVGGYGHYDLGFCVPNLIYDGIGVRNEHYLSGKPPIDTPLRWRDFQFMPDGIDLMQVAGNQVDRIRSRIVSSGSSRIIVVLHTPPMEDLLGIPPLHGHVLEESPSPYAFFRAYLGNRAMGEMLDGFRDRLTGVVCGHTHRIAGPKELDGATGVNIGSDYGDPRAVLYDSSLDQWRRIEEGGIYRIQ